MNRSIIFLIICLLATVFFAGCHEPTPGGDDGDGTDTGDGTDGGDGTPPSVTLTVQDPPAFVNAGEPFNLTVRVEVAEGSVMSSHSGFHYGFNSSEDADPAQYTQILDKTSPHVLDEMTYPGEYMVVNWTIAEERAGETVYYRAHVSDGTNSFWGEELSFIVNPLS